jgi:drug/metabolite transporter (DMT)-like permease
MLEYVLMVVMAVLWAGAFVVGKLSVSTVPPEMVTFLRFALAGVVLLGMMIAREKAGFRVARKDWALVLGLGATGIAAYNLLFFRGLHYAPSSDASMIIPTLNPFLTMLAAAPLLGERLTPRKLGGAAVSLFGQVLLFGGLLRAAAGDPVRMKGDLIFLAAAFCWSAYSILGRKAALRFTPLGSTTWATLTGLVMIIPFALWTYPGSTGYTGAFWAEGIYLALGATVGAFLLWGWGLERLGAGRAAIFINLVPVFSVAMAVLFLGEQVSLLQGIAMVIVMCGVYFAGTKPAGQAKIAKGESA